MKKLQIVLLGIALSVSVLIPHYAAGQQAQPQPCDIKTVSGRVVSLDWVASVLIIYIGGDELSLVISKDTIFRKGADQISFSDINQSDSVSVKYFDCGFAGLKAISVTVTTGGGGY